MTLRDHQPVVIEKFGGLWARGSKEEVPLDHFQDCINVLAGTGQSFGTRPGLGISQDVAVPLSDIRRTYNYPTQTGNTLIVLAYDADQDEGSIYHYVNETTLFGPLLTIEGMTDFAFTPYAGRAYISPFSTFDVGGLNVEKGLEDEFLYVYLGAGVAAQKAAGIPMSGSMTVVNGAAGHTDPGIHIFGFVSETDTGFLSEPGVLTQFTTASAFSVSFSAIPTSGDPHVVKRHLVATKVLPTFNGDLTGYQFFFVPNATINDNVTTVLVNISFYDADLLDDASHLFDNFSEIPAGAVLTLYHNRLVLATTFDDISLILVSAQGEPEAISELDGLLVYPPDGNPITNAQELRDVLYTFKRSKTVSFTDNGDVPSSWPLVTVDTGLGTCVHGIATVLDSGSSSVDYLIIANYQGISLFNGRFISPELSWKIEDYWKALDRNEFRFIQIVNAPIQKWIIMTLPTRMVLVGNYSLGMDPKQIRWFPWSFEIGFNTVAIWEIDEIILGGEL